jgi:hypothetical protein
MVCLVAKQLRTVKVPALSLQRTQGQGRGTLWFGDYFGAESFCGEGVTGNSISNKDPLPSSLFTVMDPP